MKRNDYVSKPRRPIGLGQGPNLSPDEALGQLKEKQEGLPKGALGANLPPDEALGQLRGKEED